MQKSGASCFSSGSWAALIASLDCFFRTVVDILHLRCNLGSSINTRAVAIFYPSYNDDASDLESIDGIEMLAFYRTPVVYTAYLVFRYIYS